MLVKKGKLSPFLPHYAHVGLNRASRMAILNWAYMVYNDIILMSPLIEMLLAFSMWKHLDDRLPLRRVNDVKAYVFFHG